MIEPTMNLLDYNREDLAHYFAQLGEKPFRAAQVIKWVHQLGVTDFAAMTNISLSMRQYLSEHAIVRLPLVIKHMVSTDGTQKWLLRLNDGGDTDTDADINDQIGNSKNNSIIETVFIPEKDRGTLCISTQVGCAMGCVFCATGKLGFKRNLMVGEIVGQVRLALRELQCDSLGKSEHRVITNVVIMGMGEPLLNFDGVVKAISLLRDDLAYGLSKYRITLSTVGLIPEIKKLSKVTDIALAISLHATTDDLRNKLIPISKKYPLADLLRACKDFYQDRRRKITFEYIMIDGVNDGSSDAKRLVKLIGGINCKVNLIPCNADAGLSSVLSETSPFLYQPSPLSRINEFRDILMASGINTITRKTRGADIAAACGQLSGGEIK